MIKIFYKNKYISILIKKTTNKFLLDCLFLCLREFKKFFKARSPPVLLINLTKELIE